MEWLNKVKQLCTNSAVGEGLAAVKYELLRKTGVAVCDAVYGNIVRFLPASWRISLFMKRKTGRRITHVILAQAAGHTLYLFKDKMSPEYAKMTELLRQASWAASATAMVELTNVDELFDMLVPEEAKTILKNALPEVDALEKQIEQQRLDQGK